jgi:O-antigen ligase
MAFNLFLLWTFVLLGRPQDLIIALQPLRPALALSVLSAGSTFFGPNGSQLSSLFQIPEVRKYFLFFLIIIIGIPFAYHRRVAFNFIFFSYMVNMLFFLIFVLHVASLKNLKTVLFVISLCTLFYGFFGLMKGAFHGGRFEIYGGMFDSNDIAYVLISLFPLSLYFIFHREGFLKRIIAIISIFTSPVVILYSGSRGGFLGLIAMTAFFLLTKTNRVRRSHKIVFIIVMIVLFFSIRDKIDIERYMTITDIGSDYNVTDEFGRTQLWKRGIDLLLSNPLTGVGVDCSSMAIGYARETVGILPRWQVIHNSYLQVAIETGVIAFILYMSLMVRNLKTFWQTKGLAGSSEEITEIRTIAWLINLGFIGHLITAFFLSQGYSILFTLFFSLSTALGNISTQLINQPANEVIV